VDIARIDLWRNASCHQRRTSAARGEARTMLAEIYNWFSEGIETPDLKDAKALLNELAT
jgi:hypothetical protein